ncbi:hypothetical protein [Nitrososphaera viennensis]|uniref:Uncharacterized protein n=1 Tax=Nitrososphaera viennensis TaxID=1034015 RepID=A0A977ICA0_9ARCH|nr:hypothetical protein [Nitrososphaera viennensis]UVS68308.1 hypothetical protein NWT39_10405 [Nitrososphaera viennensis]
MSIYDAGNCKKIEEALKEALSTFDKPAVRVLLYHLEEKYHIRFEPPCSSVEEIEAALFDIAGPASDLVVSRMRSFLR